MKNGYFEEDGIQYWYLNGMYHREDGPAVIYPDGTQAWYLNGDRHRDNGPAFTTTDGTKVWYVNGECHRDDGPAVIYSSGINKWWVNDIHITTEVNQWFKEYNLTYETMEFEDTMALKFFIRGLA